MTHLPTGVRAALRFFAFYLGNGTVDVPLLDGIDYRSHLLVFGSDLEMVFAIFTNVLEVDEHGETLNDGDAQYRAAQWIRARCDPGYRVEPPFEAWETELHGPGPRPHTGAAVSLPVPRPPGRAVGPPPA